MDIFHYKRNDCLVIIDYYLRWIEIKQLTSLTSDCVISRVKTVFTTHGIPDVVVSDNGRQFVSDEFRKFAKSWCFAQHTGGEKIARPRRMGDRSVELSCVAPQCNRRITGSGTNGSSTRHTTARCEKIIVATSTPRWGHPKLRAKTTYKRCYDRRHGVRKLPLLQNGEPVLVKLDGEKQWSTPSTVFRSDPQNRSYVVKTGAGICHRRNRKHLQGVPNVLYQWPAMSLMIRTFRLRIQAKSCRRTVQVMKSCRRTIPVMQSSCQWTLPSD